MAGPEQEEGSLFNVPTSLPPEVVPPDHAPGDVPTPRELTPEGISVAASQEPRTDVDWPPANQANPDDPADTPGWNESQMPSISQGHVLTGPGPGGDDYAGQAPMPPENTATGGAPG